MTVSSDPINIEDEDVIIQAAHVRNVGQEIGKSEVISAVMLHGLEGVLSLPEFSQKTITQSQ